MEQSSHEHEAGKEILVDWHNDMKPENRGELFEMWNRRFNHWRPPVATEEQIEKFESEFEPLPEDFRQFLLVCGGGGGDRNISGLAVLTKRHRKLNRALVRGEENLLKGAFVVGVDGAGNLFGVDRQSGSVVLEDHNFGGHIELAPSFLEFLRKEKKFGSMTSKGSGEDRENPGGCRLIAIQPRL